MGRDHPDGTLRTISVSVVAGTPEPEIGGNETAVLKTSGKVSSSSQTYQTLASWTVTAARNGVLRSIELAASDYALALFQVTIAGVVQFTDLELPDALTALFAETRLEASAVVLLEGKSSDGTSVDMWGMIEGKEVG